MMINRFFIYRILTLAILLGLSSVSFAQISSIGKDWGGLTLYSSGTVTQDSIFVFFSSTASPKKGKIKAKFSDGSASDFKWYKYNSTISNVSNRFELIASASENGVVESSLANLDRGGYKVVITKGSDIETYYCWVMIDDVVILNMSVYNGCDFLEVNTITVPSKLSILNFSIFSYWDIKSSPGYHRLLDKYGKEYFSNIVWHASDPKIVVPTSPLLTLTIGDPAPLYDSKYNIKIVNPFGRELAGETSLITAKATDADFTISIDKDNTGQWVDGGSSPGGEAPLRLKFDTKSINADSVYWNILNDKKLFKKDGDSIIWNQGYKFAEATNIIPEEELVPGTFPVEHIAFKVSSGCRDTMTVNVEVDSSLIKPDAIPNVFTPNDDGVNDSFLIKDVQNNVTSIKTFKVSILSRQGLVVYTYSGNPKKWDGWNGKIDGNKRDAPEGIYYFIVEARGWDDRLFKRGPYKGFLYLYRGK